MGTFEPAIALSALGDGVFAGSLDPAWSVTGPPKGGYLGAVMLRCLARVVGDGGLAPRTLTVHFVAVPEPGEVQVHGRLEHPGRRLRSASARMTQGERTLAVAVAAFSAPRSGPEFQDRTMPELPEAEAAGEHPLALPDIPEFFRNFEYRGELGERLFSGADGALTGGWIRLREPRELDAALVTTYLDAWPPAVLTRASAPTHVPSIEMTVHFLTELPPPGAAPEDFYAARFEAQTAGEGFAQEDGELWTASGRLIACSRQLAAAESITAD
jgi:acyl-CoA thioesterase